MDEMTCDYSQFQIANGSNSCMATSMCCCRLFLEQDLQKEDLHRVLQAGAILYGQWRQNSANRDVHVQQYWTCVTKSFPNLLRGVSPVFESNGFFDRAVEGGCTFDRVLAELSAGTGRRSGVLTSDGGSYALCYNAPFYYIFNSHGGNPPNDDVAIFRRTRDRTLFRDYVVSDAVGNGTAQFSVVLFDRC